MVHDMLMLGSGHGDDEGAVDHALMLLALLMRDADVAYMFTVQVLPSTSSRALPAPAKSLIRVHQERLASVSALLLPTATRVDTRRAALVVLYEQCEAIAASQQSASAASIAQYPMNSISDQVLAAVEAPFHLFAPAARVLHCCCRIQRHPATPDLMSRLADPSRSFSTTTAIQYLRQFLLPHSQNPKNITQSGACPHTDEDLIALNDDAHQRAAAADVVGLLLRRLNHGHSSAISSAADVLESSPVLLDIIPRLPPAAVPDVVALLSVACAAATNRSSAWQSVGGDTNVFASGVFLRMMGLLPHVSSLQQLHILSCARSVMQVSASARAVFRLRGASEAEDAVAIMMKHSSSGAAAAAAASVLPFICSDHIDAQVNITAYPTIFPSAAASIASVSTCAHLTPSNVSVIEGIVDFMYACR